MQKFLDAYMGLYVQCLIEYGELPSFGGDSVVKDDGDCNAKFENFSGTGGRPPVGGAGVGGDKDAAAKDGSASSDGTEGGSSGGSGGGAGSSYAGSASRGGSSSFGRSSRASRGADGGSADPGKTVEIALDGGGGGSFFKGSSNSERVVIRKVSVINSDRIPESLKKKIEKNKNGGKTVVVTSDGGFGESRQKVFIVKPPESKKLAEETESSFSVSNFIRILFISVIILIIVIFVGGQFLQMSKGGGE